MSTMIPFEFNSKAIRVIEIDGEPWFVGKDVAEALGYVNATDAIKQHCRGVAKRYPIVDALGRSQKARVLNEPDVLRLMISSTLPAAQEFEALVFEVILPTIRKTGRYAITPEQGPSEREQKLLNELLNLQRRHLKAMDELEDFHSQIETTAVAERMINQGMDDEAIAQAVGRLPSYIAHLRELVESGVAHL